MAERAAIHQSVQIGIQSDFATEATAGKTLPSLDLMLNTSSEFSTYRATGQKLPRLSILNREWTVMPTKMPITVAEQLYPLASLFRKPTISTPGGGTLSRSHLFNWNNVDADDKAYYTIQQGGGVRAVQAVGCFWNDGKWTFNRKTGMEFEGSVLGTEIEDAITMDASPTEIELVPLVPGDWSIYLDTAWAGLGTTKLLRWMSGEFGVGNIQDFIWPVDSSHGNGPGGVVEDEPTISGSMALQADAVGMAMLTQGRDTVTKFMRIVGVGPIIEGAIPYKMQFDLALQISNFKGFRNSDKTWDVEFDFITVKDPTSGKGIEVTNVCKVTAL